MDSGERRPLREEFLERLGPPPSKLEGLEKVGKTVMAPDGTMVTPEMARFYGKKRIEDDT